MWSLPRTVGEVILEAWSSALDVDPVFLCSGYTAQTPAWSAPVPQSPCRKRQSTFEEDGNHMEAVCHSREAGLGSLWFVPTGLSAAGSSD